MVYSWNIMTNSSRGVGTFFGGLGTCLPGIESESIFNDLHNTLH